jgi:hypothetical protein
MQTVKDTIKCTSSLPKMALYTAPIIPKHPKIDPCGLMSTSSSPYGKRLRNCR